MSFILILIWINFTIGISFREPTDPEYLVMCLIMFYITLLINFLKPINMSFKVSTIFLTIPSIILWYIAYKYNNFLSLDPISEEFIFIIICTYFYAIIYIISEY